MSIPEPRHIGAINWLGLWTHYAKEVKRFYKVGFQTLVAPVITTLLFLAIFTLALGGSSSELGGVPFEQFLAPGLIMMAIIQNSFSNTTSSLMISKIQGNIVDMLMPPISPGEITSGFVLAGATRGLLVALSVGVAISLFVPLRIYDAGMIVFHGLSATLMLSLMGLITAVWADKFDQIASITNFVIMPLSFLSGTFYSIERLPPMWQDIALINPFFYIIDGFRHGFIGHHDGSPVTGVVLISVINACLWWTCHRMFSRGYKLKN